MPRAASYKRNEGMLVGPGDGHFASSSVGASLSWEDEPLRIRSKAPNKQTVGDRAASMASWEDDIPPIITRAGTLPSRQHLVSHPGLDYPDDELSERGLSGGQRSRALPHPNQRMMPKEQALQEEKQQQHFPEDEITTLPSREDLDTTLSTLATMLSDEDETKQQSEGNDCDAPGMPFLQRYTVAIVGSVSNCEVPQFGSEDGDEGCRAAFSEEEDESKLTYDDNGINCDTPGTITSYEENGITCATPGTMDYSLASGERTPRRKKSRARRIASFLTGLGRTTSLNDSLTTVTDSLDEDEAQVVTSVSRQLKKERAGPTRRKSLMIEQDDDDTWGHKQTEEFGNEWICQGVDEKEYLVRCLYWPLTLCHVPPTLSSLIFAVHTM